MKLTATRHGKSKLLNRYNKLRQEKLGPNDRAKIALARAFMFSVPDMFFR